MTPIRLLSLVSYDTAYPGSMNEDPNGLYVRIDDPQSLLAALYELIMQQQREIADLSEKEKP